MSEFPTGPLSLGFKQGLVPGDKARSNVRKLLVQEEMHLMKREKLDMRTTKRGAATVGRALSRGLLAAGLGCTIAGGIVTGVAGPVGLIPLITGASLVASSFALGVGIDTATAPHGMRLRGALEGFKRTINPLPELKILASAIFCLGCYLRSLFPNQQRYRAWGQEKLKEGIREIKDWVRDYNFNSMELNEMHVFANAQADNSAQHYMQIMSSLEDWMLEERMLVEAYADSPEQMQQFETRIQAARAQVNWDGLSDGTKHLLQRRLKYLEKKLFRRIQSQSNRVRRLEHEGHSVETVLRAKATLSQDTRRTQSLLDEISRVRESLNPTARSAELYQDLSDSLENLA